MLRGKTYYQMGAYDSAVRDFEACLGLDPRNAEAYYNLAVIDYHEQNYDRSRERLERAKRLGPVDPELEEKLDAQLRSGGNGS